MDILKDFLQAPPPPNATIKKLDFTKTTPPIPAYKNHFAAIIDNALTPAECNQLLHLAEQSIAPQNKSDPDPGNTPWDRALLNVGNGKQVKATGFRNCGRIIYDSPDIADRLLNRLLPFLRECDIVQISGQPLVTGAGPATRGETFKLTRLNEKLRFLKYTGGEYFRAHTDGCYVTPDERERSLFTVHLYLNGEGEQDEGELRRAIARRERNSEGAREQTLLGGATSFRLESYAGERVVRVFPKAGSALVFQQRGLCHAGDDVFRGVKYTMRSDMMYEKVER
ncbi:hypothetical protein AO1008_08537 [Aspergillus oryzae 100-8]|uniref:Acylphosphatase-like domain-containing protein n=1 Tax=Aspergillus oryzae (strain 3.042) TaxID=1160506 RepID=I8AAJ3_ASPO3|nr:hypothetical protein Ao3042_00427 [Aspergillus oryzae 3.042]KDE81840.1 hypothetical protein AO1008_08537 [Aspergillus oryzae 100-8]|eukprot:EIT82387.1 hypothetical protein Ao3042_00427 [Aspergillus oryzae 3.042]